jgi:hypothetical protein
MGSRNPADTIVHRTLALNSWTLIAESKRLMLSMLERRNEGRRRPEEARLIGRLRQELELAESRRRANLSSPSSAISAEQLAETHERLIRTATACADRLSTSAQLLPPSERLRAAVAVQALDELVDQWRQAAAR